MCHFNVEKRLLVLKFLYSEKFPFNSTRSNKFINKIIRSRKLKSNGKLFQAQ